MPYHPMAIVSGEKIYTWYQIIIISGLKLFITFNCEPAPIGFTQKSGVGD